MTSITTLEHPTLGTISANDFTLSQLSLLLFEKGLLLGFDNVFDKTKIREIMVAEKLGHEVHSTVIAGKGTINYGSDATDPVTGKKAEYKSQTLRSKDLRSLFQEIKFKNGQRYAPLTLSGVYNGFNSNYESASVEYEKVDHYFSLFWRENPVAIYHIDTDYVMNMLIDNYNKWDNNGRRGTSNCNSVKIQLESQSDYYKVKYIDENFFTTHAKPKQLALI
jgi:hypothetical protein